MSIFVLAIGGAVAAGLMMVLGGIVLVYKGAMALAGPDRSTAFSLEWKKTFRLHTQAPGIAFFLVGLLFIWLAIFYSQSREIQPIAVLGKVTGVEEPIKVTAATPPWEVTTTTDGKIDGEIFPNIRRITVEITAPGYKPVTRHFDVEFGKQIEIPTISLARQIPKIVGRAENIKTAPAELAPLDSQPSFGSPQ